MPRPGSQVAFERRCIRAGVGKRSPRQIRRALLKGQTQALNERGVPCREILRVIERFFESPRGSMNGSTLNLNDAVVPSCLEELATQQQ